MKALTDAVAQGHQGRPLFGALDPHRPLGQLLESFLVEFFQELKEDLRLRGPGEFLGTRQSGLPDFRVANLVRDTRLLAMARETAEAWVEADPKLAAPASVALRAVLQRRWAGRLGLASIG